jgi:hypothetical protein
VRRDGLGLCLGRPLGFVTKFRQELFRLADEVMSGLRVQFIDKGVVFQVAPERTQKKLDGLVGQPTLEPNVDLEQACKELAAEMEAEWVHDWSET